MIFQQMFGAVQRDLAAARQMKMDAQVVPNPKIPGTLMLRITCVGWHPVTTVSQFDPATRQDWESFVQELGDLMREERAKAVARHYARFSSPLPVLRGFCSSATRTYLDLALGDLREDSQGLFLKGHGLAYVRAVFWWKSLRCMAELVGPDTLKLIRFVQEIGRIFHR